MPKFANLHIHSHYSLLKALPKIPELVAAAKAEGCTAIALTDLGNMYATIEFYKECKNKGIKPILGLEVYLQDNKRLILLAENKVGYKNLLAIVTKTNFALKDKDAVLGGPNITTLDMLRTHAEGIIAIAPEKRGIASSEYTKIFEEKNFYTNVAMHETFYIKREDRHAWEVLKKIGDSRPKDESDELDDEDDDFSFFNIAQMEATFTTEQLAKTLEIADRCNVKLELGSLVFPAISIPENSSFNNELRRLIEEGVKRRGLTETTELRDRIEYEYNIICNKGYSPYFLVVADLLDFARNNGILTTIRGSVAGSMVTYVIGITNVNPLEYKLPFERFLNPERPSAPDIDMDYADNRRDEVIDYARQKYGINNVAQIGTFGTLLARGVVRDVTRALGYPYGLGDRLAKAIPLGAQGFPMTLDRALNESPEFAKMYKETEAKEIIDLGKKLEGCARHISVHAAGVVISPKPLMEYSPLQKDPKGNKIITQYDMHAIEDAGLLKFDFLGIRNLAILSHAVSLVEKHRNICMDIETVVIDDIKTFEMLARGETEGTFQLNGAGMTRYLKELRPTTIHDINAMVALFRPGPMETIPQYIERKHKPHLISYLDPRMREYLDDSYGLLVYQDDVLLTSIKLAGYSWLEADKLRKAIGKKIPEVMQAEKEKLLKGFQTFGKLTPELGERLWKLIEPFAAYGFNKAHAASYGKVAYQTAYMKANFPVEYMTAVLTAESGDINIISIMVNECKRMGIPVLPPDVNESFGDFTVIVGTSDSIRFGLYSIKHFGSGVADAVIAERSESGPFISLSDFLRRIKRQGGLNKKGFESLVKCGALDSMGERAQMLKHIEQLLEYHRDAIKEQSHDSLFADLGSVAQDVHMTIVPSANLKERLEWEKELLGLYVSGHPLDLFKEILTTRPFTIAQIKEKIGLGIEAVITGMISNVRVVLTKKGDPMAFVKLVDYSDSLEVVVFQNLYEEKKDILKVDTCIAVKGKLAIRNGEHSMIVDKIKSI